ncbi:MAG: competence damage-inducible protein A, partial [Thermoplasmataceae archaeon]
KMVRNDRIAVVIKNHYTSLNVPVTPEREKMSMVPEGSKVIENPVGSAPGVVLDIDKCRIILLPGVPTEMEALLSLARDEYISDRSYCENSSVFESMMESTLAPEITRIMRKYDGRVYIKSHPLNTEGTLPRIEVEVSAYSDNMDNCTRLVKEVMAEISKSADALRGK